MRGQEKLFLLSMGTRPEIIKMAPVYHELKRRGQNIVLLHTGQHNEMAASLYQLFDMKPDYTIALDEAKRSAQERAKSDCDLSQMGSVLLEQCGKIIAEIKPSHVLVHGDTSSALMMAIASYYQKYRIAHVEAGLRSYDEYHPFPEEKNRTLIAHLRIAFCPHPARQTKSAE